MTGTTIPVAGEAPEHAAARPSASVPVRPVRDDKRRRKAPLAWLPWALLAALLALLALMLLAGTLVGKSSDGGSDAAQGADRSASGSGTAEGTDGSAGAGTGSGTAGSGSGTAGSGSGGAAATGAGTLTAGSTDVLADRASLGRLSSLEGQPATGREVLVQSVVADEGFWVGSSTAERVFVFLTPQARQSSGESGFQVRAGQRVDLEGTVKGLGNAGPSSFGVSDAEGGRQLTSQRAYVAATQVALR